MGLEAGYEDPKGGEGVGVIYLWGLEAGDEDPEGGKGSGVLYLWGLEAGDQDPEGGKVEETLYNSAEPTRLSNIFQTNWPLKKAFVNRQF